METHLIAVIAGLMVVVVTVSFSVGVIWGRRAAAKKERDRGPKTDAAAPPLIVDYSDDMEIPAALIGARCKELIENAAPNFGLSPVDMLRAVIATGLAGERPLLEEHLNMLDEILKEEKEEILAFQARRDEGPQKPN